jgi:hypothetical protein
MTIIFSHRCLFCQGFAVREYKYIRSIRLLFDPYITAICLPCSAMAQIQQTSLDCARILYSDTHIL